MLLTLLMPSSSSNDTGIKESVETDGGDGKEKKEIPKIWDIISVVWLYLTTKVITSVANSMSAAAFPLILKNIYGLNEQGLGTSMAAMSACNAIVNGFFLEPLVKLLGNDLRQVISYCIIAMGSLSALQAVLALPVVSTFIPGNDLYFYLGTIFALSIFQYVLATTITGESTAKVGPNAKGTLLGLEHALFSAARVASPQMGVSILNSSGVSGVASACTGVFVFVLVLWNTFVDLKSSSSYDKPKSERKEK